MVSINCENCGKFFQAKYSAEMHKVNCLEKSASLFTCKCGKKFASRTSFYAHKRVCQSIKELKKVDVTQYECQENDCAFKSTIHKEIVSHLMEFHNISIERNQETFDCYSEFEVWKDNQEKVTDAQFIISHSYNTSEGKVKIFRCNRSGKHIPATQSRKRALKSQGTRKIGFKCTANMKVFISNSSGAVNITFFGHYGHKHQLRHLRIPAKDRKLIASELAEEVKYQRVLNNLFTKDFTKFERKHIIQKQDLDNISRQYGLQKVEKHPKDYISLDLYVQENLQDVLVYKRQFEEEFHHPKIPACPLQKNDFLLCVMTAFQRDILKKFGGDIVCCDATHGTNVYDFKLITLLVVDEFQEGVPVAWMISNRETAVALTVFFRAVKDNLGDASPTPQIFMSDKAPQYYNSFKRVFGCVKKLLCHWHVLKDFNANVRSKLKKDKQDHVYKSLRALLEEPRIEVFRNLLDEFLDDLGMNTDTQEFLLYFEGEWLGIQEEWAKCYRIRSGINTNMFVEAFHKKTKTRRKLP